MALSTLYMGLSYVANSYGNRYVDFKCALGSFYLARCATAEKRLRNTAVSKSMSILHYRNSLCFKMYFCTYLSKYESVGIKMHPKYQK